MYGIVTGVKNIFPVIHSNNHYLFLIKNDPPSPFKILAKYTIATQMTTQLMDSSKTPRKVIAVPVPLPVPAPAPLHSTSRS